MQKYTHLELDSDIHALAGYYTPQKEVRLKHGDREVLYVVGQAVIDGACCSTGSWVYALVPGYIVHWQAEKNSTGRPVTEVEPVADPETQKELLGIIKRAEGVSQVEFW